MYADWMDIQISYLQNFLVFPTLLGEAGSDCSTCIVLFDPLPALSLCLLHDIDTCSACISPLIKKKHWIKQVIDQYFFHHCIMTLILSVTDARTYYVRSVSSMLKNLETVQVPGLHLKRNYLVTRKKFKIIIKINCVLRGTGALTEGQALMNKKKWDKK